MYCYFTELVNRVELFSYNQLITKMERVGTVKLSDGRRIFYTRSLLDLKLHDIINTERMILTRLNCFLVS